MWFAAPSLLGESRHLEIGSIREVNVSLSDTSDNLRNGCRMAMCRDDMCALNGLMANKEFVMKSLMCRDDM
ncbi:hypothetical protein Tco_1358457, partial [Tanacetum coccineum]